MHSLWTRKPVWIGMFSLAGVLAVLAIVPRSDDDAKAAKPTNFQLMAVHEGMVKELVPGEGKIVERGEDVVLLDDGDQQKALELAQVELQQVAEGTRSSDVAVALPGAPAGIGGRIIQTGPFNAPTPVGPGRFPSKLKPLPAVSGAGNDTAPSAETIRRPDPKAGEKGAAAEKEIIAAKQDAEVCQKNIDDAKLELEEAQKATETSRSITDRARQSADRAKMLLTQGAISANEAARLDGQARAQEAILKNNQAKIDEIKGRIAGLNTDLQKAQDRQTNAEADFSASKNATVEVPKPESPISAKRPVTTMPMPRGYGKPASVVVRASEGSTAPAKVEIDPKAKRAADDQMSEAKAKYDLAEKAVLERRIVAGRRMRIVKWLIGPGDIIRKGQPIAVIEYLPDTPKAPVIGAKSPSSTVQPLQKEPAITDNIH